MTAIDDLKVALHGANVHDQSRNGLIGENSQIDAPFGRLPSINTYCVTLRRIPERRGKTAKPCWALLSLFSLMSDKMAVLMNRVVDNPAQIVPDYAGQHRADTSAARFNDHSLPKDKLFS
ncbi:hypothetical protein AB9K34_23560 [Sedimentitalea sp. XS_ASV28]|uniref:hypothetical protein n=1 Tax=Sedimentitalea sp. XS_ASV28 TaxID=3241296 RepID=UPI00351308AF